MKTSKNQTARYVAATSYGRACIVASVLAMGGCGTLTDVQLEAREHRRAAFDSRFNAYRSQCHAAGKRIVIDAIGKVGRDGMPKRGDSYFCV